MLEAQASLDRLVAPIAASCEAQRALRRLLRDARMYGGHPPCRAYERARQDAFERAFERRAAETTWLEEHRERVARLNHGEQ